MSIFSEKIITLKKNCNLRQKDIASDLGVSLRAYQYYESAQKEPTLSVLLAISNYFCISIDYLLGRTNEPNYNFYLDKAEKDLLINMPHLFVILFLYAKNHGLQNLSPTYAKQLHLIKLFERWKKESETIYSSLQNFSYDDEKLAQEKWKRQLQWDFDILFNLNIYPSAQENDSLKLSPLPNYLINYLHPIADDDMQHREERTSELEKMKRYFKTLQSSK